MEQPGTGWSINLGGSPIDPFCPTLVALSGDLLSLAPDDPPLPVMLPQLPTAQYKGPLHKSEGCVWRCFCA